MSFTSDVKKEICTNDLDESAAKAVLSAFFQMGASLHFSNKGMYVSCRSEHARVAKFIFQLVKKYYQAEIEISIMKQMKLKKNNMYILKIKNEAMMMLKDLNIVNEQGLQEHPPYMLKEEAHKRAYLAGAFLSSGSVNSPTKSNYHLEIACNHQSLCNYITNLMNYFHLQAKSIRRRNQYVAYVKASDKISDFLKCVGSSDALYTFEGIRVERDFMNSLSRLDNCELANEMKTLAAAKRQLEDIDWIDSYIGLQELPQNLARVAFLRKANPESNLKELCALYFEAHKEEISKSGMRHRLNKLRDKADQYRK
ncbi:MAG: DNA-binding protein WhiA [Breznakia sp.]